MDTLDLNLHLGQPLWIDAASASPGVACERSTAGTSQQTQIESYPRLRAGASGHLFFELAVAEAGGGVVVDQADGLHESVTDGGADEAEAAIFQVFAHGVGY